MTKVRPVAACLASIVVLASQVLSGCAEGDGAREDQTVRQQATATGAPETPAGAAEGEPLMLEPADVAVVPLRSLGVPDGAVLTSVDPTLGRATVRDGSLRIATGEDGGAATSSIVGLTHAGQSYQVPVTVQTWRPTLPVRDDPTGRVDSSGTDAATLEIDGLAPKNIITARPFSIRPRGFAGEISFSRSTVYAVSGNADIVDLRPYWKWAGADGQFRVGDGSDGPLTRVLAPGDYELIIGIASRSSGASRSYRLHVRVPSGVVEGRVLGPTGQPLATLAGALVALRGFDTGLRLTATVDKSGSFSFADVVPGTHEMVLLDPERPGEIFSTVVVRPNDRTVRADLVWPRSASAEADTSSVLQVSPASPAFKAGADPVNADEVDCGQFLGVSSWVYRVQGSGRNVTRICRIQYEIPEKSEYLVAEVSVRSTEIDYYMADFNDTWSYQLNVPGTRFSDRGSISSTHASTSTRADQIRIDVRDLVRSGPYTITGAISSTNGGNTAAPTAVTLRVRAEGKQSALRVVNTWFERTTTHAGETWWIIQARKRAYTANPRDAFVSIPTKSRPGGFDDIYVPLRIQIDPPDAQVHRVRLRLRQGGVVSPPVDFTGPIPAARDGVLHIDRFVIPTFPDATRNLLTAQLLVQLEGTTASGPSVSPEGEGAIRIGNPETDVRSSTVLREFTPLFLAQDVSTLAARRYGDPDNPFPPRTSGGDSWADARTIQWLLSNTFRFDDISAAHIAQVKSVTTDNNGKTVVSWRSVLDHAGHDNGRIVDLRYADGKGGFTDALSAMGGAGLKKLLEDAASEVAAGVKDGSNLALAQAWIRDNRATLKAVAKGNKVDMPGGERLTAIPHTIVVGDGWMSDALIEGKFASGELIPEAGEWSDKPPAVIALDGHHDHWHVGLKFRLDSP